MINSLKGSYYSTDINGVYKITEFGILENDNIKNKKIIDTIIPIAVKDAILIDLVIKEANPYSLISIGLLKREATSKLSHAEKLKITDIQTDIRLKYFLNREGFIKTKDGENYRFNKRGRKLIEIGNYEQFKIWEVEQSKQVQRRQLLNDRLLESNESNAGIASKLYWINLWIAVGTGFAAIAASIAAFYYIFEINSKYLPHRIPNYTIGNLACLLAGITLGILLVISIQELLKRQHK